MQFYHIKPKDALIYFHNTLGSTDRLVAEMEPQCAKPKIAVVELLPNLSLHIAGRGLSCYYE